MDMLDLGGFSCIKMNSHTHEQVHPNHDIDTLIEILRIWEHQNQQVVIEGMPLNFIFRYCVAASVILLLSPLKIYKRNPVLSIFLILL